MHKYFISGSLRIFRILPRSYWKQNCYVILDETTQKIIVVDPGEHADTIISVVEKLNGKLEHVLVTHAHHDHVGVATEICQHFDVACLVHEADLRLIRQVPMYALRFSGRNIKVPKRCAFFDSQAKFSFGTHLIKVIPTPGHTLGSVCFTLNDCLLTGDTLLFRNIGRADLPGGNLSMLKESVSQLLSGNAGDSAFILPGHGRAWRYGAAREWWRTAKNDISLIYKPH